jgi:hypothetical protein
MLKSDMSSTVSGKNEQHLFLTANEWVFIILMAIVGLGMNHFPFNMGIFLVLQILLPGTIFIFYMNRPVMMVIAFLFLAVLPAAAYGGFTEELRFAGLSQFYYLSATSVILFLFVFWLHAVLFLKKTFKFNRPLLIFIIFMVLSIAWTVSMKHYSASAFWLMCALYLMLPIFISNEKDFRLVVGAYIIYLNAFCLSILPLLFAGTDLDRGTVLLNPNYASFGIVIGIAIILSVLTQYKRILSKNFKLFLYSTLTISILTMSFFVSVSSFIMFFIVSILFLLYNSRSMKVFLLNTASFATMFVIFNYYGFFEAIESRFRTEDIMIVSGRDVIQKALLESFAEFDLFSQLFGKGFLTTGYFGIGGAGAHNSYISILISFGLIGLLIYLLYLLNIFIRVKNSQYSPFLMLFTVLLIWGVSIEPYIMITGIFAFCLLTAAANFGLNYNLKNPENKY